MNSEWLQEYRNMTAIGPDLSVVCEFEIKRLQMAWKHLIYGLRYSTAIMFHWPVLPY